MLKIGVLLVRQGTPYVIITQEVNGDRRVTEMVGHLTDIRLLLFDRLRGHFYKSYMVFMLQVQIRYCQNMFTMQGIQASNC